MSPDNDNEPKLIEVAAESVLWHTRTYNELLRPRLRALADDRATQARALATQLGECISCRRPIRCEVCPVARSAGRF